MDKHLDYYQVRWKNFKGFTDTDWIKIKPLTIILGANNAGKTNFLAPLLLMSQTLASKDRLSPLIMKGEIFDGGNFQEVVKNYDLNNEVFLGFRYHTHETDKTVKDIGSYPPGSFEITLRGNKTSGEIDLKKVTLYDVYKRKFLTLTTKRNGQFGYKGIGSETLTKGERAAIETTTPTNFLFSSNTILSDLEAKSDIDKGKAKRRIERFSKGFTSFLSAISYNNSRSGKYLGDLSFIGPIRENPHRIYEVTNETYNTVGTRGENTINLIKKLGDTNAELNEWIKKFEFGDKIELKHHYSNTYSLRFKRKGSPYYTNISNSGFGASQILPLIVQALVSPDRNITIAEQPEIHLNPKIQGVLADLFVEMTKKGQTVIIETHSEHLLLRLRRLIAEKQIQSDKVAIYFVEKNNEESAIREVKLQTNGHIDPIDWPKNFFGESLKESFAIARAQSVRKK